MEWNRSAAELAAELGIPPKEGAMLERERSVWAPDAPMNAKRFALLLAVPVAAYVALAVALSVGCVQPATRATIEVWRTTIAVVGAGLWAFLLQARFRYLRLVESMCHSLARLSQSAIRIGDTLPPGEEWRLQAQRDIVAVNSEWDQIVMLYRYHGLDYPEREGAEVERLILSMMANLFRGLQGLTPEERALIPSAIRAVAEATSRRDTVRASPAATRTPTVAD